MNSDDAKQRRRIVVTLDSGDIDTASSTVSFVWPGDWTRNWRVSSWKTVISSAVGTGIRYEFRLTSQRSERFESARVQQELRVVARRAERALAA